MGTYQQSYSKKISSNEYVPYGKNEDTGDNETHWASFRTELLPVHSAYR